MVTMIDEIYDRHYQEARSDLNASILRGLSRFGNAVINAFNVLNRIEYDAPWAKAPRIASFH
jgi:hypothetical protein